MIYVAKGPKRKRAESTEPDSRVGKKINMGDFQIRTNLGKIIYKARRVKYGVKVEIVLTYT